MKKLPGIIFIAMVCSVTYVKVAISQTTNVVLLDSVEQSRLRNLNNSNQGYHFLFEEVLQNAEKAMTAIPQPRKEIHYEGLLENNKLRIETVKSLEDVDHVVSLIYASYLTGQTEYGKKAISIVLEWAQSYIPTGNPINENKFSSFFLGYHLFGKFLNEKDKKTIENWLLKMADAEKNRLNTPNNNWEAKRLKIIGFIGCILKKVDLTDYSVAGFKKYIATSYFPDGTSIDLKTRDALHYHIGGLTPCLSTFIILEKFDSRFNLFAYETPSGSSIKKSVEYVLPYATGEKQREEWKNTTVQLDRERAAAGFAEYQPGKLFDPSDAIPLFEWASYYHPEWMGISKLENKPITWVGLLNSNLIREKQ